MPYIRPIGGTTSITPKQTILNIMNINDTLALLNACTNDEERTLVLESMQTAAPAAAPQVVYTAPAVTNWEYKNIRFDFLGRGITQEFNILDVDGERMKGWFIGGLQVTNLPEMMNALGGDGWEIVSHVVNQDNQSNNVTLHYMTFKRPGKVNVSNTFYDGLTGSADGGKGNRAAIPFIA